MTETPTEEQAATEPQPQEATCVHCGATSTQMPGTDWQCPKCERYQDSAICPTCHQIARKSLMEGAN